MAFFDSGASASVEANAGDGFFPTTYEDLPSDAAASSAPPFMMADASVAGGGGGIGGGGMHDAFDGVPVDRSGKVASVWTGAYDDEAPLLEELGINWRHIWAKTSAVLHPTQEIDPHIMDDTDLAGPLVICLLLGLSLLLRGKLHFGYIYGFGLVGCVSIWFTLNLMSERGIDVVRVVSVLGYCLLPMVLIALMSLVFPLRGFVGLFIASLATFWCTKSASKMFVAVLHMVEQRMLVAYPVGLIYACFAMMAVF